jgi:flagellar FliL protein
MESAAEIPLPSEEAPSEPRPSKLPKILAIVVGLAVGAAIGVFVAGPVAVKKLIPDLRAEAAAHAAEKKAAADAPRPLYVVDNLVLNPANSGGTRFLMVTATFQVKDAAANELLKSHDAEVRDVLLGLFGRKTVEQLTDVGTRESVKGEVLAATAPLFPSGTIQKVFFPQFVIQ